MFAGAAPPLGVAGSQPATSRASARTPPVGNQKRRIVLRRRLPSARGLAMNDKISLMAKIILFNKPYGVLSQFTPEGRWRGLGEFISIPGVYPAGRLDADSEGLLLLTDEGPWQAKIADPRHKLEKTYWVQLEGLPDGAALARLSAGVELKEFTTRPARVRLIEPPAGLWPRDPPIRFRAAIPTCWVELAIREGKNRQVRRMCAAVGFPVLRLVRSAIGPFCLGGLPPGASATLEGPELARMGFSATAAPKFKKTR